MLFQKLDGFGIGDVAEIGGHDVVQALQQALVHELVKEAHLLGRILQNVGNDVLDHILSQTHIVGQIGKRDFRLDHPELGGVARGVGVFGAEGGAEGVDVAEGHGEGLAVELAGDGQIGGLAEEVLGIIDLAVLRSGRVIDIKRRDLEHFARALAVGAGNERRMDVDEAALLEELVDGERNQAADTENGLEGVGARAQMRDGAQILHGVALGLDGKVRRGRAFDIDLLCLKLKRLLGVGRQDERTGHDHGGADVQLGDLGEIRKLGAVDDLHLREKRAVGQVDEAEVLAGAQIAHPAADLDLLTGVGVRILEKRTDGNKLFHDKLSSLSSPCGR